MAGAVQEWTDPRFLDEAHAWIRARLTDTGAQLSADITQQHLQPWSTVLRVPTDRGALYFKAIHHLLRHEAAVAAYLGRRRPDHVPEPVAVDIERGWILMEDAGARLRELIETERSVGRWLEVLPLYASLQLDLSDSVDDLLALGVPDLRHERLSARYSQLLDDIQGLEGVPGELVARARERTPAVADMSSGLATYGIPETIQHDDLNDSQIYFRDGRYLVLDWGDACISHPFFSLSVALEGQISWGLDDVENSVDTGPFRDAYLAVFAQRLGSTMEDLQSAAQIAIRLGWACRAANGHVPGEDPMPTVRRLQMFLDGRVDD